MIKPVLLFFVGEGKQKMYLQSVQPGDLSIERGAMTMPSAVMLLLRAAKCRRG